jgi:PAS domain S-box-containing protein
MQSHAVVVSDREGKIHLSSPGAESLLGYPASEALGQSLDLIVPPKFREKGHAVGAMAVYSAAEP